jgi:hypothetical protein
MAVLTGEAEQVRQRTLWTPVNDPDDETPAEEAPEPATAARSLAAARALLTALEL